MNNQPNMTEKELLTDLLNQEKELVKGYASNVTEASCANFRSLLIQNMTECSDDQLWIFEQMRQRNMYKTKQAMQKDIQTAQQNVDELKQQSGIQ